MKVRILLLFNKQIVFLLSVLGFSLASTQCAAQYGAPISLNSYSRIKGIIKTEENIPIKNIRVVIDNDTTYTDSNGVFKFTLLANDWSEKTHQADLLIVDVDGKENGIYYCQVKTFFLKPREEMDIEVVLKEK